MVALDDAPPVREDVPQQPAWLRCPFPPPRPRLPAAAADGGVSSTSSSPPASPRRVVVWVLL